MVVAAERCFVERSYSSTTIAGIAEASGVSTETVYAIFKNKRAVLQAVIKKPPSPAASTEADSIGDDLLFAAGIRAEPEQRRRFALVTEATRGLLARTAAHRRSGPSGGRRRSGDRHDAAPNTIGQTLKDVRRIVASLAEAGPLRMSESDAADRMWALVAALRLLPHPHHESALVPPPRLRRTRRHDRPDAARRLNPTGHALRSS